MNRQDYLRGLEKELKAVRVPDYPEIISEYDEHFRMKLMDGYTEEEIAARLMPPKEIAEQMATVGTGNGDSTNARRILTAAALISLDIVAAMTIFIFFATVIISFGACAIAMLVSGIFFAAQIHVSWSNVPFAPYPGAALIGAAAIALAVLSAVGTYYGWCCFKQITRSYIRWHKNILPPKGTTYISPPIPLFPAFSAKKRRVLRAVTMMSLVVFFTAAAVGFVSLVISAGNIEFWHVWYWFE